MYSLDCRCPIDDDKEICRHFANPEKLFCGSDLNGISLTETSETTIKENAFSDYCVFKLQQQTSGLSKHSFKADKGITPENHRNGFYKPVKWCSFHRGDYSEEITLFCKDRDLCNLQWNMAFSSFLNYHDEPPLTVRCS